MTSIIAQYRTLLEAWDHARQAAQAIDRAKYPHSREMADDEVSDRAGELWKFKDDCALEILRSMTWLRESGRYDDVFASLIKDAVHDLVEQRVEQYRAQTASLAQRVEELEAKLEQILNERNDDAAPQPIPIQGQRRA